MNVNEFLEAVMTPQYHAAIQEVFETILPEMYDGTLPDTILSAMQDISWEFGIEFNGEML